jgi:hypothetical protein
MRYEDHFTKNPVFIKLPDKMVLQYNNRKLIVVTNRKCILRGPWTGLSNTQQKHTP